MRYSLLFAFICFFTVKTPALYAQIKPAENVKLHIIFVDKDTVFTTKALKIETEFATLSLARTYVKLLPSVLAKSGYFAASVDSVWNLQGDLFANLYCGKPFAWIRLNTDSVEPAALAQSAYLLKSFNGKELQMEKLEAIKQDIITYYENNGYPFAKVLLDDISFKENKLSGGLRVEKGPLYFIDSIRVYGNAKLSKKFLQRFLGIPDRSLYSSKLLRGVDKRLEQLPYVQSQHSSDISMLGDAALLNVYLKEKKISQFNFLVGLLPGATVDDKLRVTGDINLDLKNLLGSGENFILRWQSLQPKSARLNLGFDRPYIFSSPFGLNFDFEFFKKDSSFIQIKAQTGISFSLGENQTGKLFGQFQNNILQLGSVDTVRVKQEKTLPINADLRSTSVGLAYDWLHTDYRFNPRKGEEISVLSTVGIKSIKRNNEILEIKDPTFNVNNLYDSVKAKSFQLRLKVIAAKYFPLGRQATFKAGINAGYFASPNTFRNELFQIGGYKLLRGFNEESIYATRYAVGTAEFRYLVGKNSYLFTFVDAGLTQNKYLKVNEKNKFTGFGFGILNETKFGLLNLSLAAGKRSNVPFNLKADSKIHFGYINYF